MQSALSSDPISAADAADWWRQTAAVRAKFPGNPIDRAIALGAHADRLSYAFLGGYTAAITVLDPSITDIGALCATESGGGHPRAMLTTLAGDRLSGTKQFVSGGPLASVLLVVAKVGEVDGRPDLKLARISARAEGVKFEEGLTLDFVPEVPHGAVTFTSAQIDRVLEGDGYERYLKPFRTIEDLHVFGAVIACLVSNGKRVLPQELIEQLLAVLAAIAHLGREDARDPTVHLALAGVLRQARALIDSIEIEKLEVGFRERWLRDRVLLGVAQRVREQRRTRAWAAVDPSP